MIAFLRVSSDLPFLDDVAHRRLPQWSFEHYEMYEVKHTGERAPFIRLTDWLMNTDLFEQAWGIVCAGAPAWWWSEQLCAFTAGPWTIYLFIEGNNDSPDSVDCAEH